MEKVVDLLTAMGHDGPSTEFRFRKELLIFINDIVTTQVYSVNTEHCLILVTVAENISMLFSLQSMLFQANQCYSSSINFVPYQMHFSSKLFDFRW